MSIFNYFFNNNNNKNNNYQDYTHEEFISMIIHKLDYLENENNKLKKEINEIKNLESKNIIPNYLTNIKCYNYELNDILNNNNNNDKITRFDIIFDSWSQKEELREINLLNFLYNLELLFLQFNNCIIVSILLEKYHVISKKDIFFTELHNLININYPSKFYLDNNYIKCYRSSNRLINKK
jgi:hypothetical protein